MFYVYAFDIFFGSIVDIIIVLTVVKVLIQEYRVQLHLSFSIILFFLHIYSKMSNNITFLLYIYVIKDSEPMIKKSRINVFEALVHAV